jgi:hypothetical protein
MVALDAEVFDRGATLHCGLAQRGVNLPAQFFVTTFSACADNRERSTIEKPPHVRTLPFGLSRASVNSKVGLLFLKRCSNSLRCPVETAQSLLSGRV